MEHQANDFLSVLAFAAFEFTYLTLMLSVVVALIALTLLELVFRAIFTWITYGYWRMAHAGHLRKHGQLASMPLSAFWLPYRQFCGQMLSIQMAQNRPRGPQSREDVADIVEVDEFEIETQIDNLQRSLGTISNLFNYVLCTGVSACLVYLIAKSPRAADDTLIDRVSHGSDEMYVLVAVAMVAGAVAPLMVQVLERRVLQR